MPHVSPKKVNGKVLEKIYESLFSAVTERGISSKHQKAAFNELLTQTEKVMLGKRLAAFSLLSQGESSYKVGKLLQLSPTTVMKFQLRLQNKKVPYIEKLCDLTRKSPIQKYIENLFKPLPRYGTSPHTLFKDI